MGHNASFSSEGAMPSESERRKIPERGETSDSLLYTHTPSRPSVHSDTDRQFPEVLLWWIKIRGHAAPNYPFLTLMLPFWLWLRASLFFSTTFSLWLISFFTFTFSLCLTFFDRNFLWFYLFKQSLPHIRSFSLPYFYCILDCNCSSVYLNRRNRIPNRERNMRKKKRVEWCHGSEVNGQYNRVTTTHVIHTVIIFWSMVACF